VNIPTFSAEFAVYSSNAFYAGHSRIAGRGPNGAFIPQQTTKADCINNCDNAMNSCIDTCYPVGGGFWDVVEGAVNFLSGGSPVCEGKCMLTYFSCYNSCSGYPNPPGPVPGACPLGYTCCGGVLKGRCTGGCVGKGQQCP